MGAGRRERYAVSARVLAVVATYRRPALLRRLLLTLGRQGPELAGVIVVDNGRDPATAGAVAGVGLPVSILAPAENLGTAGGLAAGIELALADAAVSHVWIMDDDAEAAPGAMTALLRGMEAVRAVAASPLVTDRENRITWFPGPLPEPAWSVIRLQPSPEIYREKCGSGPQSWAWAIWVGLLISRQAIESVGLPLARLWYQGTDIEYTLRLSAFGCCVLVPGAVCPHLPPSEEPASRETKEQAALQNGAYIACWLRHGRRSLRHLPGNHWRYWRNRSHTWRALGQSVAAFWRGAVLGQPAGR